MKVKGVEEIQGKTFITDFPTLNELTAFFDLRKLNGGWAGIDRHPTGSKWYKDPLGIKRFHRR